MSLPFVTRNQGPKVLAASIALLSFSLIGLPARANSYRDYVLVQAGSVHCAEAGSYGNGLHTFNCSNGSRYKWCDNGMQFYITRYGDEGCK